MRRQFPQQPIVGVGGVVIERDAVLLVRRRHDPQKGEWTIPGGRVELGEKIKAAVQRELREETHLSVEPVKLVGVFERIVRIKRQVQYHYVVLDYACRRKRGRVAAASDVSAACWASRRDLPRYKLRPETLRMIQRAFATFDNLK